MFTLGSLTGQVDARQTIQIFRDPQGHCSNRLWRPCVNTGTMNLRVFSFPARRTVYRVLSWHGVAREPSGGCAASALLRSYARRIRPEKVTRASGGLVRAVCGFNASGRGADGLGHVRRLDRRKASRHRAHRRGVAPRDGPSRLRGSQPEISTCIFCRRDSGSLLSENNPVSPGKSSASALKGSRPTGGMSAPRPQTFIKLRRPKQDVLQPIAHALGIQRLRAHGRVCREGIHDRAHQLRRQVG